MASSDRHAFFFVFFCGLAVRLGCQKKQCFFLPWLSGGGGAAPPPQHCIMRPKRSLRAEAAQRERRARVAPYGLRWSEVDRRALAYTACGGRLLVWTRPDGVVTVDGDGFVPFFHSYQYDRQGDQYVVTRDVRGEAVARLSGGQVRHPPALPEAAENLRVVLRRPEARARPGWRVERWVTSEWSLNALCYADARALAREAWLRAEQAGVPLVVADE